MPLIFFLAVTKCLSGDAFTSAISRLSFLPWMELELGLGNTRDMTLQVETERERQRQRERETKININIAALSLQLNTEHNMSEWKGM